MFTVRKSPQKESSEKYIKKNYISSTQKNKYKPTSLKIINSLPILSSNNFTQILSEYSQEKLNNESFTQKIEILDDGSVCKKNTKHTTRIPSPSFDRRYFELDNIYHNNSNYIISDNINNNEDINYQTYEINNSIKEELINNTGIKYNKSLPNIKTFTYKKSRTINNNKNKEIYIPQKPFDSSGKNKINIKSDKIKEIKEINYIRNLFNKNKNDNDDIDIINLWKYLSNKSIINYNKNLLKPNMQIIIQNLKIQQILKKKTNNHTNLINIKRQEKENINEIDINFFDELEKKCEKNEKINKYKGGIESINEEMNESYEESENKRNSIRSIKNKEKIKINKRINELEIKDIESISYSPLSTKSKDIKFIFNKNIKRVNDYEIFLIYKKEINDKKGIKLIFNENNNNINKKYNININSYKKILKMAFYNKYSNKRKIIITKDKYESLLSTIINNFIIIQNKNKINNKKENISEDINKKIVELEKSVKELKDNYIYGIKKIHLIQNKKDKYIFIKKLNITKKRNNVKKIYKEIVDILNNDLNENDYNYYQKIIDTLKQYEKINEKEIKNKNTNNNAINMIKLFIIFLPLLFALKYFSFNFKRI